MARKKAKETKVEDKTQKALDIALGAINKEFGSGSIMRGQDETIPGTEFITSGCISVDRILGGGWAKGRVVEIYGPESSGKTTLTLHAIAAAQARGETCAFIDMEHALDPTYADALGVNMNDLLISQPTSGEQALRIAETLIKSNAVSVVVIDSVAALLPKAEIDKEIGESAPGRQAALMSQALRKLPGDCKRSGTTLIFINQIRMKIGVMFGSPETTSGGNALKFYASQRIDIRRIGGIKDGTDFVANRTRAKCVKNKVARPFKQCEFDIKYGEGIDATADVLDLAVELDVVNKNGAWYDYQGERIGQGRNTALQYLKQAPAMYKDIEQRVRTHYGMAS